MRGVEDLAALGPEKRTNVSDEKMCLSKGAVKNPGWFDFYTGIILSLVLGILKSPGMGILIEQLAFVMHSHVFQADKLGSCLPCSWERFFTPQLSVSPGEAGGSKI